MKHRILIALVIAGFAVAPAGASTFAVKAAYFMPGEQAFKDIYGAGLIYGGEIGFRIAGSVGLWVDGMFYSGKGKLTYTQEETKLTLMPIGAGLRIDLTKGAAIIYAGGGARYYTYKETNVIGTARKSGLGFVGLAGLEVRVVKGILLGLRGAYSSCSLTPADFTINVGGLELGGGLIFEF